MKKRITGLTGKLMLGIIIFGILLGSIISIIGYWEFTSVLEQQYNDSAYEIAETAARYLNPDKFEEYLSTGKVDEEYRMIEKRLDDLVDATDTTLIYVAKVDVSDYRTLTYIYDSVNSASGFDRYPLGYTAVGVAEEYVNNVRNIITKGERATEYLYSYSEESGAHTTAGIAIYDSRCRESYEKTGKCPKYLCKRCAAWRSGCHLPVSDCVQHVPVPGDLAADSCCHRRSQAFCRFKYALG